MNANGRRQRPCKNYVAFREKSYFNFLHDIDSSKWCRCPELFLSKQKHTHPKWHVEEVLTQNEIQHVILTDKKWVFILKQFQSIYRAEWFVDPFVPKFYSLIQNIIGLNFGDGLNFVTREHSLTLVNWLKVVIPVKMKS